MKKKRVSCGDPLPLPDPQDMKAALRYMQLLYEPLEAADPESFRGMCYLTAFAVNQYYMRLAENRDELLAKAKSDGLSFEENLELEVAQEGVQALGELDLSPFMDGEAEEP